MFKWRLGNGHTTSFWLDTWYEDRPLQSRFGRLYKLSKRKNTVVAEMIKLWKNNELQLWERRVRGWEIDSGLLLEEIVKQNFFSLTSLINSFV